MNDDVGVAGVHRCFDGVEINNIAPYQMPTVRFGGGAHHVEAAGGKRLHDALSEEAAAPCNEYLGHRDFASCDLRERSTSNRFLWASCSTVIRSDVALSHDFGFHSFLMRVTRLLTSLGLFA